MSIATYFPDAAEFLSASGVVYKCGHQEDEIILLMAYATQFKEGETGLEEFLNNILENYSIELKQNIKDSVESVK